MTEPSRVLHLVDGNGEAEPVCEDCLTKDAEKTRMARSYEATIRNLRQEIAEQTPDSEEVRSVLEHWAKRVVEEGWWSKRPAFRPGHPRWQAVNARLQEPEYDVDYCLDVVEGALFQGKQGVKREWVDASSIFKAGNIERHYERAQDPYCAKVKRVRQLPDLVWKLIEDPALPFLCEECSCGHARFDHQKPDIDGMDPCLVHGCWCRWFDEGEAWMRRREEEARRRQ